MNLNLKNRKEVCMAINANRVVAKVVAVLVLMGLAFFVGKMCGDIKYLNYGYKEGYNEGYVVASQEWGRALNDNKEAKTDRMKQ